MDYDEYTEFMRLVKEFPSLNIDETKSFIVNLLEKINSSLYPSLMWQDTWQRRAAMKFSISANPFFTIQDSLIRRV
jgi:hypothetical protein